MLSSFQIVTYPMTRPSSQRLVADAERERNHARQDARKAREAEDNAKGELETVRVLLSATQDSLAEVERKLATARADTEALSWLNAAELAQLQTNTTAVLSKVQDAFFERTRTETEQATAALRADVESKQAECELQLSRRKAEEVALAPLGLEALDQLESDTAKAGQRIRRAQAERRQQELQCGICFIEPKKMAFRCGHRVCMSCGDPASEHPLQNCPECRELITQRIKLF